MIPPPTGEAAPDEGRTAAESDIAADIRALTVISEQLGQVFAQANDLRPTDFRALTHIATADAEGHPLTAGRLGSLLGLSSAAITYLVERMIASGHIRRETDPGDRRKVILRYAEHGMAVANSFFGPLGHRTRAGMSGHSTEELLAAHRVLQAVIEAMRDHHSELTGDPTGTVPPSATTRDRGR